MESYLTRTTRMYRIKDRESDLDYETMCELDASHVELEDFCGELVKALNEAKAFVSPALAANLHAKIERLTAEYKRTAGFYE